MTERAATRAVTAIRKSAVIRGSRLPDYDLVEAQNLYGAFSPPSASPCPSHRTAHDGGGILSSLPMGALIVSAPTDEMMERIALDQDYTGVDCGPGTMPSIRRSAPPPSCARAWPRARRATPRSPPSGISGPIRPSPRAASPPTTAFPNAAASRAP